LTTTNIRTNATIRQGLSTILTEEEARRWLLLFGAAPRPASALEVNEIQSLVFGGLGFLKYAMCIGFALGDSGAREWLAVEGARGDFEVGVQGGAECGPARILLRKLDLLLLDGTDFSDAVGRSAHLLARPAVVLLGAGRSGADRG
jgi:hypothetical protein